MSRREIYDAIKAWIELHGLDAGFLIQKREWRDGDKKQRFIVIQQSGGGKTEEAITRDYFRITVISGINDPSVDEVEERADIIRQAMIDDHTMQSLTLMTPIGGVPQYRSSEGRWHFEVNFQAIISRDSFPKYVLDPAVNWFWAKTTE